MVLTIAHCVAGALAAILMMTPNLSEARCWKDALEQAKLELEIQQ